MRRKPVYIGIDVGSVSVNTVVVDSERSVIEEHYTRTRGEPIETSLRVLSDVARSYGERSIELVAATGSGGKLISSLIGAVFTNEVIVQARAVGEFYPEVRTVIEMGGQDAKLILLSREPGGKGVRIDDFQMNSICAAGTGSFLDQQAGRMNLTIEEFGRLALTSKNPPRIAGRCSVFAKSDMIHLQQIATADYDIVAGLCYAVARNFKSTIGRGKDFNVPVAFQGGVAANPGVRKAFRDVLGLSDDEFIVPERFASMGAIGAVLVALDKQKGLGEFLGLDGLSEYLATGRTREKPLDRLVRPKSHPAVSPTSTGYTFEPGKTVDVYLGLDVGSTSTNLVLIEPDLKLVAKRYLSTAGRPIEAIRAGLEELRLECGERVNVIGVGSTGSGRYLTSDYVGGDVVRNEITAQATAAITIDPSVDTIFEIGGQDSKYISLRDGVVVDFEMNKVCAAGTGSFLEEQAERIDINIREEFSELALACEAPAPMGDRCTVFIESDMVHHSQRGVDKGGLVSGLSYAIVYNYLNRVVGDRRIGKNIFFQGGTAANLGVVAAFEKITGKKITVPNHHDVTGAIGAAILAMREMDQAKSTSFKGFDLSKKTYSLESFECKDCSNLCEIRKVVMEDEDPLYYGSRCEKYDVDRGTRTDGSIPDLFKERERLLLSACRSTPPEKGAPEIGIARTLLMHEQYPFWKTFFSELGFRVRLSAPTNKAIINKGLERVVAETCFPIKVAHGHIEDLIDKGVKRIFVPSIVDLRPAKKGHDNTVLCPYVQTMPYLAFSAFDFKALGVEVINPVIHFNQGERGLKKEFRVLGKLLGKTGAAAVKALKAASETQARFQSSLIQRGAEAIAGLGADETALVIVGRTYNTTDPALNLQLPRKLLSMGVMAIPFDMLPIEAEIDDTLAKDMYWKSGQRILAAAKLVKRDPRLHAVYITNFGCGPDSFITHFFRETLGNKPFLQLEIDEHSADAGAITRCEAFLDSLKNVSSDTSGELEPRQLVKRTELAKKIYLPNMADGSYALAAAFEACGMEAEVMAPSDEETLRLGRAHTSGRECYPNILTMGDIIKTVKRDDFDPEASAFFMPSGNGPCRFGQYNRYTRLILDEMGLKSVVIYAPDQDEGFYAELGMVDGNFPKYAWWGISAVDLLEKRLRETRPYEKTPGETDRVYWEHHKLVCDAVRQGRFPLSELINAKEAFRSVPVRDPGTRPLIGVVGEIYVRTNRFSNEDLVVKLENLGAEVRLPPVGEWIFYTNFCSIRRNWVRGLYGDFLRTYLTDLFQHRYESRLEAAVDGDLRGGHEPRIREILDLSSPYLHDSFEGEAVLSVGKVIDFISKGAHGIVNVMPFTCMPGTIVNGVMKRVREEHVNIPYVNMVYEGVEDTNAETRLEAFLHQAVEFKQRRSLT